MHHEQQFILLAQILGFHQWAFTLFPLYFEEVKDLPSVWQWLQMPIKTCQ
jgi:hypothetical protein